MATVYTADSSPEVQRIRVPGPDDGRIIRKKIMKTFSLELQEPENLAYKHDSKCVPEKLGWLSLFLLVSTTIGLMGSMCFITFLWFYNDRNDTWRLLANRGWVTRAIALASVILRASTGVQASIATSMLASLALEHTEVLLIYLPTVSTIRSGGSSLYSLTWYLLAGMRFSSWFNKRVTLPSLAAVLSITTLSLQFTSTLLLMDVRPGYIIGYTSVSEIGTNIGSGQYVASGNSRWRIRPHLYPTFAEYSKTGSPYLQDGIADTGVTIRAFLPINDQQARSSIHQYEGAAAVIDARVLCLRPNITDLRLLSTGDLPLLSGKVSVPSGLIPRPSSHSIVSSRFFAGQQASFECEVSENIVDINFVYHPDDWRITLCQLRNSPGILIPEFFDKDYQWFNNQTNYLAINYTGAMSVTTARLSDSTSDDLNEGVLGQLFNSSKNKLKAKNNKEWLDIYSEESGYTEQSATFRFSLCIPSFSSAEMQIKASGGNNRTEPLPRNLDGKYRMDDVRAQLMLSGTRSLEERGILELSEADWILKSINASWNNYISESAYLSGLDDQTIHFTHYGNLQQKQTLMDFSLGTIFLDTLRFGGTLADALQATLTTIAGMEYYDQIILFDNQTMVNQTFFVEALIPGGNSSYTGSCAGMKPGYVAVMVTVTVHCILMVTISTWFFLATSVSTLSDSSWQGFAQIQSDLTESYLANAGLAGDSKVQEWMKADGLKDVHVGITLAEDGKSTKMTTVRHRYKRLDHAETTETGFGDPRSD